MRVLPLLVLWVAGAVSVAWTAHLPTPYRHGPYPLYEVSLEILFMAVEIAALVAVLRPRTYSRSWSRALGGFLLSLACFLCALPLGDTAWPYDEAFLLWMLCVVLIMLTLTVWSSVSTLRLRHGT
jgi:peptidoglycan/LPS O-acetylase OafA/YrhL